MTEKIVAARFVPLLTERQAFALTLWGEARGESFDSKVAVGEVLLNRLATGRWGKTINAVVAAPKQFSCFWPYGGASNHAAVLALAQQLAAGQRPADSAYLQCEEIARQMTAGALSLDLEGATHYLTKALYDRGTVKWAQTMRVTATVGAHVFGVPIPV